jgi:hypothetical protein
MAPHWHLVFIDIFFPSGTRPPAGLHDYNTKKQRYWSAYGAFKFSKDQEGGHGAQVQLNAVKGAGLDP